MYFTLIFKKASILLAQFYKRCIFCLIDRYNIRDTYEIEGISDLTCEWAEYEFSTSIFAPLRCIGYISYRFTIEIMKLCEVKEYFTICEFSYIGDDVRKSRIYICFIEFAIEGKYLYTSIGDWFFDFELGKHKSRD